jgi:hypothetical protein
MANYNLIRGAATAYKPTFVDAGAAVSAGIRNASYSASPQTSAGLNSMKQTDAQVKAYVDSLNTEMDLLDFSEAEQNSIKAYLFNQKKRYAQLATELAQTDPTGSYYLELKNGMDGIKQSFLNLKSQTDKFKERKIQYLDDLNNGRLSKGNKPDDYNLAGSVYGGGAMLIDENGGINVITDGGKNMVRYADIKDPVLKDFKTADEILKQNNQLYNAGVKLDPPKESLLRNQLRSLLSQSGSLESIVEDGLINNERLNVDIAAYATREDAINDVAEMLLQGYRDSSAAGANEKMIKQQKNNPGATRGAATSAQPDLTKSTGYSQEDRKIYYNKIVNAAPGVPINVSNFSGTNDPAAKRGYGQIDYKIIKSADGNYAYIGTDREGQTWSEGIITPEQLKKEFLGSVTQEKGGASKFNKK